RTDHRNRRAARSANCSVREARAAGYPGTDHTMTSAAIESSALLKMLYSSLIAGIGISLVFSIAIFGAVRSGEKRRDHRTNAAFANDALAACALVVSAAIVAYGLLLVAYQS